MNSEMNGDRYITVYTQDTGVMLIKVYVNGVRFAAFTAITVQDVTNIVKLIIFNPVTTTVHLNNRHKQSHMIDLLDSLRAVHADLTVTYE